MIQYHGTPVGGTRDGAAKFLAGRDCLIPWRRDEDLWLAKSVARSFIVDNSAFTAWIKGEPISDWSGYYEWVASFNGHPSFQWAIIPDVIDGSEEDNDRLISEWPSCLRGVPVWHYHESLERLEYLIGKFPRICLGSSGEWPTPGTDGWWDRTSKVMNVCCDDEGYPRVPLHGLRMLNHKIFQRVPLSSADSTNAAQNGVREALRCGLREGWRGQIILAWKIESRACDAAKQWKCEAQQWLFS